MNIAYITVVKFGDDTQKASLRDTLYDVTGYDTWINWDGNVMLSCLVVNLGGVLSTLASSRHTDWIEYTIQFDNI